MKQTNLFTYITAFFCLFLTQQAFAHFTTKGPYGGSVSCIAASDTLVFIGTYNGGVYRSTNSNVTSWRYANYSGLGNPEIKALACIGNKVLAGTVTGIYRSADEGASWAAANSGLGNLKILSLLSAGDHVFAGTDGGGLFMSHDSGTTWLTANVGLGGSIISSLAYDGANLYAGTRDAGVFISDDEGETWSAYNDNLSEITILSLATAGGRVFVLTPSGVYATGVSSTAFNLQHTGLSSVDVFRLYASGGVVYAGTSEGVYSTPFGSVSWTAANTGYKSAVTSMIFFKNRLLACTEEDGMIKSNSTASINWLKTNTGLNNLETYAMYNDGNLVIVSTNKGLFISRDLAANYEPSNNGLSDSLHINCIAFAGSDLYAGTENKGLFVSTDTGRSWTQVSGTSAFSGIKHTIAVGSRLVISLSNGTIQSTPLSAISWTLNTGVPVAAINDFASSGSILYTAVFGSGVYTSTDALSWTAFNSGLSNMNVTSLAVKGSDIYAGTMGSGVFKSGIASAGWAAVNNGIPNMNILSMHATGPWVVAGYKGGVHITPNDGVSWKAPNVTQYLPEFADVHTISFTENSTRIFVATPYNSLYSNGVAELPVGIENIRNDIGMVTVSPNPSSGSFKLDASSLKSGLLGVSIYDLTGRELRQFSNTDASESLFLNTNLPAGLYYIKAFTAIGAISQPFIVE